jgi:putative salt-induced outer membrane protein
LDRSLTELSYAFLRATYEKKRFSGFQNQSTAVIGYGHYLVKNDVVNLKLEVGIGEGSDKYDECYLQPVSNCKADTPYGERVNSILGYFAEGFSWQFSKTAELGEEVSVEDSSSNRITRFHAYVKSELMSNLSMKLAYTAKYTDITPADKLRLDEETSASLIYSF